MAHTNTHQSRARDRIKQMVRRVVLIAEGKSTRKGLEMILARNIPSARKHLDFLEGDLRAELEEKYQWAKAKLLAVDPETLPEEKNLEA